MEAEYASYRKDMDLSFERLSSRSNNKEKDEKQPLLKSKKGKGHINLNLTLIPLLCFVQSLIEIAVFIGHSDHSPP